MGRFSPTVLPRDDRPSLGEAIGTAATDFLAYQDAQKKARQAEADAELRDAIAGERYGIRRGQAPGRPGDLDPVTGTFNPSMSGPIVGVGTGNMTQGMSATGATVGAPGGTPPIVPPNEPVYGPGRGPWDEIPLPSDQPAPGIGGLALPPGDRYEQLSPNYYRDRTATPEGRKMAEEERTLRRTTDLWRAAGLPDEDLPLVAVLSNEDLAGRLDAAHPSPQRAAAWGALEAKYPDLFPPGIEETGMDPSELLSKSLENALGTERLKEELPLRAKYRAPRAGGARGTGGSKMTGTEARMLLDRTYGVRDDGGRVVDYTIPRDQLSDLQFSLMAGEIGKGDLPVPEGEAAPMGEESIRDALTFFYDLRPETGPPNDTPPAPRRLDGEPRPDDRLQEALAGTTPSAVPRETAQAAIGWLVSNGWPRERWREALQSADFSDAEIDQILDAAGGE